MKLKILIVLPLCALVASCANRAADVRADAAPADSFPLPSVPEALTAPADRAAFVALEFWNNALLPDSVTDGLEQAMANFGAMVRLAGDSVVTASAAKGLISAASTTPERLDAVMEAAEHYFYDPNSPERNEELFIELLRAAPADERRAALLEQALKNRPGTLAADFAIVTSAGRRTTLGAEVARAPQTLVYFFDTECPVCKELIPTVDRRAKAAGVPVLAIAPQANAAAMADALPLFPADWTVASDLGDIDARQLYIFPALPAAYLLDSARLVIAKDLPL